MTKLSIKDWDEADMPREKLERLGAEALSPCWLWGGCQG